MGTWGDQNGKIRECAEKAGIRGRQATLSGDGILRANWVSQCKNVLPAPTRPHRVIASHQGCFSVGGAIKGSFGRSGLTFKSDEEPTFHEIFS